MIHPIHRSYVVPASHAARPLGGAVDDSLDRDNYCQTICFAHLDRHGRGDELANARLIAAAPELLSALRYMASEFADTLDEHWPEATQRHALSVARDAIARATSQ